jgi:hypothetical protein
VPRRPTAGLHGQQKEETFGPALWHGPETVPQRLETVPQRADLKSAPLRCASGRGYTKTLHRRDYNMANTSRICSWLLIALGLTPSGAAEDKQQALPSAKEMAASNLDLWGDAALRLPDGPTYEFFKDLLPPLRYANTDFRHYPIVLGSPAGVVKARYVSNGSAVNARANKKPMWKEAGVPVHFFVGEGDKTESFGDDLARLDGPRYADGYLPIVQIAYSKGKSVHEQEAFAPVRGALADHGAVMVRFAMRGGAGTVTARVNPDGPVHLDGRAVCDGKDEALVLFDAAWEWDADRKELRSKLNAGQSAVLVVLTLPLAKPPALAYDAERQACVACWQDLLKRGTHLEVPEKIVNDAWRSHVIGNYLIAVGDRMHYSAGNAYDHLYEAECGDAVRALLLFGQTRDARQMVGPLLDFYRKATRYHVAGHKLQLLTHYYWVTRDRDYMKEKEKVWQAVVDFIMAERKTTDNGLMPKDNYAGDIATQVYALNSSANCWRGLRDLAAVLANMGEKDRAAALFKEAADFRKAILAAVAKSEQRDTKPPFIPNALFGAEKAYDTLNASRMGSYYDLMAPYIIGSGVFGPGNERESWMIEYLRQHGGLAMGMIRTTPQQGEFAGEPGVNVLYGLRYQLTLLRRDERDRALVGFYGHLAQGMTRDTFIGGEGSRFFHGDKWGRSFYLPPNSTANAMFLTTVRYLLIQDWDLDDDGRPETLRLLFGVPRQWLKDGAAIKMERAPTMFGEISLEVRSRLAKGEVLVTVESPKRRPEKLLVRLPLPSGWRVTAAQVGKTAVPVGTDGTVDVASQEGRFTLRFAVAK